MVKRWRSRGGEGIETPGGDLPLDLGCAIGQGALDDLADEQMLRHPDRNESFVVLYRRYAAPVLTYCRLRIGNVHDAEDAAAQVFARAYGAFPTDDRGSFRAWLFTIAHHTVVNHYRKQKVRGPARPLTDDDSSAIADPSNSPESAAMRNDDARELRTALAQLRHDQRQVIELRLAGLKGAEIASVLGRSESAVKMLQFRAMARLREVLVEQPVVSESAGSQGKDYADAH